MRNALAPLQRFIATPTLSKHRLFIWLSAPTLPDHQLVAIAREDDYTFGVLHSRAHELWSLRMGTSLEDRPRYTPTSTLDPGCLDQGEQEALRAMLADLDIENLLSSKDELLARLDKVTRRTQ